MTIKELIKHYWKRIKFLSRITIFRKSKMIFLFGSPYHPNMGDQAQTYCIQKWYKENFPNYDMYILRLTTSTRSVLRMIRKYIRKDDMLVCHSGYHLTDLYEEQNVSASF